MVNIWIAADMVGVAIDRVLVAADNGWAALDKV